jgi:hypothetical protein
MTTAIKVGALSCAIAAVLFFAWWGFSIATKVFDDYKDNTDAAYLFTGGLLLAFALGIVVLTLMTGLPQHMSRNQLVVSFPIGIALLAGILAYFYYGPPSDRPGRNTTGATSPPRCQAWIPAPRPPPSAHRCRCADPSAGLC